MFDYQISFASPCQTCTREAFENLTTSERVRQAVATARRYQQLLDSLPGETSPETENLRKEYEAGKAAAKKSLPGLMFQATFTETLSKNGHRGRWRKNGAAILNGLFMLDIDHLGTGEIREVEARLKPFEDSGTVLLAFITASGHGLKIVAKADPQRGNIEANQRWLAHETGVEFDTACKDAARISFCPSREDILFINNEIFDYNNETFEQIYGAGYRDGSYHISCNFNHRPADDHGHTGGDAGHPAGSPAGGHGNAGRTPGGSPDGAAAEGGGAQEGVPGAEDDGQGGDSCGHDDGQGGKSGSGDGVTEFGGVAYEAFVEKYTEVVGAPIRGGRHQWLLRMAKDLRYVCDFKEKDTLRVLMLSPVAREVAAERGEAELQGIVKSALGYNACTDYPDTIKRTCRLCGITLPGGRGADGEDDPAPAINYEAWWKRLEPLLEEGDLYSDAVAAMPPHSRLGGVLAAGAMYGTYLTRCEFPHYDGKRYRFSYLVYILGHAASGKSFIIDMDTLIMQPMKDRDRIYREQEKIYQEQKERMTTSSKDAKEGAPQRPHYPIRYVPSTISNAKLYARLRDATDTEDESLHLHLFTLESELATALRAQVGSWAGKLDLELKSFQNEYAGVDYANEQSANGLIQVNWNQVISGTMDAMQRKMRGGSITDGYVTRLAVWVMPETNYEMLAYRKDGVQTETPLERARKERIRERAIAFDTLRCPFTDIERLTLFCHGWCARQALQARLEEDYCVEYFRKRIPLYMMRYTLPRIVGRQLHKFEDGYLRRGETLEILDSDLEFARLIGDYLMYISIFLWGTRLLEADDEQKKHLMPRQRRSKFMDNFYNLPEVFTFEEIRRYYKNDKSARTAIARLVSEKLIEKTDKNKWKKLVRDVDDVSPRAK